MRNRIIAKAVAGSFLLVALVVGGHSGAAPSSAMDVALQTAGESDVSGTTVYNFYYDYFTSKSTCDARGYALKHYEGLPNMSGWTCVRHGGNERWSMHVHYWSGGIE